MGAYHFTSTWQIAAPLETVWQTVSDSESWPAWWKWVKRVTRATPSDTLEVGQKYRYVFATKLPYTLDFEMTLTRVEPLQTIEATARGELIGTGRWDLTHTDGVTTVKYTWDVKTAKAWMEWVDPIMRPLFVWNHNVVMDECASAMAARLQTRLVSPAVHTAD